MNATDSNAILWAAERAMREGRDDMADALRRVSLWVEIASERMRDDQGLRSRGDEWERQFKLQVEKTALAHAAGFREGVEAAANLMLTAVDIFDCVQASIRIRALAATPERTAKEEP